MATMELETSNRPDLKTLVAAIARSVIIVPERTLAHLPTGYDKVDVAILRWIAADSRRASAGHRSN